jgi:hypothetical protein
MKNYCTVTADCLHYAFAVRVDTTGQCFYLDVFLQLFSFFPVLCAISKMQFC